MPGSRPKKKCLGHEGNSGTRSPLSGMESDTERDVDETAHSAANTGGDRSGLEDGSRRRRKISHSQVERRRRVRLSMHIGDLGNALPFIAKDKVDKLTILRKACDEVRSQRGFPPRDYSKKDENLCKGYNVSPTQELLPDANIKTLVQKGLGAFTMTMDCSTLIVSHVSEDICGVLGYTRVDVLNSPLTDLLHPDDVEKVKDLLSMPAAEELVDCAKEELVLVSQTEGDVMPFQCRDGQQRSLFCRIRRPDYLSVLDSLREFGGVDDVCSSDTKYCLCKINGFFRGRFPDRSDLSSLTIEKCSGCDFECIVFESELDMYLSKKVSTLSEWVPGKSCSARIDMKGDFTYIDPNWENVFGINKSLVTGKSFWQLVYSEDESAMRELCENAFRYGKEDDTAIVRIRSKDNGFRWVACMFSPVSNPWSRKPEYGVISCVPLTDIGVMPALTPASELMSDADVNLVLNDISTTSASETPPVSSQRSQLLQSRPQLMQADYEPLYFHGLTQAVGMSNADGIQHTAAAAATAAAFHLEQYTSPNMHMPPPPNGIQFAAAPGRVSDMLSSVMYTLPPFKILSDQAMAKRPPLSHTVMKNLHSVPYYGNVHM